MGPCKLDSIESEPRTLGLGASTYIQLLYRSRTICGSCHPIAIGDCLTDCGDEGPWAGVSAQINFQAFLSFSCSPRRPKHCRSGAACSPAQPDLMINARPISCVPLVSSYLLKKTIHAPKEAQGAWPRRPQFPAVRWMARNSLLFCKKALTLCWNITRRPAHSLMFLFKIVLQFYWNKISVCTRTLSQLTGPKWAEYGPMLFLFFN